MMSFLQGDTTGEDQPAFPTASEIKGYRIFIVGSGVFGLSLLRYISSTAASDKVTAYDSNEKGAACDDNNKIVRTQYASKSRTETAREADKGWLMDPVLKPYYKRIGRIEITDDVEKLDAIDKHMSARERLTLESVQDRLKSSELSTGDRRCLQFIANILKKAHNPIQCIWNKENAVIDWKPCMDAIRESLKAQIEKVKVEKLVVDRKGRITALQLQDTMITLGEQDRVVLTVGAWGDNLLKKSNISTPPKGIRAVGVFTFYLELNYQHREYLKGLPALSFQDNDINCEFLPAVSEHEDSLAKIGLTLPFINEQNVPQDVGESDLMYLALFKTLQWARRYHEGLIGAKIVYKGVHWDGVTEDQTPLISWHPKHANLGIAWGASFTRAKDFPIIGRTIYEILILGRPSGEYGWNSKPTEDKIQHNQPHLLTSDTFEKLDEKAATDVDAQKLKQQGPPYYL